MLAAVSVDDGSGAAELSVELGAVEVNEEEGSI